jgi:DNA helicase-2/ATP-dependent DNA helicase PcrA
MCAFKLNPKQAEAVNTIRGPLLIIAGAGSGKTRVITERIVKMLRSGIPQSAILALTFTNKAAKEMADRVRQMTGKKLTNMTISTFHSFGVKIIREQSQVLGFRPGFSIYDATDKASLIKDCAREIKMTLDPGEIMGIANLFSAIKTGRSTWQKENSAYEPLYREYQEHLLLYNSVDFDDLITLPIRLFEEHPDCLAEYTDRYGYIMVDEFQDTSLAQYRMVHPLAKSSRNICVVGDDDQSIYSWRGANYQNIENFEKDFPELKEIKLEQNYRSTGIILEAANAVIANNTNRKDKSLWTGEHGGRSLELYQPADEQQEAEFIAQTIKSMMLKEGLKYKDVGILVRTNGFMKSLEVGLLAEKIPYRVSGGSSFFQRKEVKDIISYLRIMLNPQDDINLLRILNTPRRGIGKSTLQKIIQVAQRKHEPLIEAIRDLVITELAPIPPQARGELMSFLTFVKDYQTQLSTNRNIAATVKDMVETLDYWGHLLAENPNSDKAARWKYQNVETFVGFIEDWEKDPDRDGNTLLHFLNKISLTSKDENPLEDSMGKVNLMTIHASKGLEFNVVFLAGVEENIIPHQKSVDENPEALEEERRLFYVAITRARKKLYMTACQTRRTQRETFTPALSPFLEEIPKDLIQVTELEKTTLEESEADMIFDQLKKRFN